VAFFVFNLHRLDGAIRTARKVGRRAHIHLEVETGLHRTGLEGRALTTALARLAAASDAVAVDGLCTHFAGAESTGNYYRIQKQIDTFAALSARVAGAGIGTPSRHAACSAASLNYPETCYDLVRMGIVQYGYWPSQESRVEYLRRNGRRRLTSPLRRILSWKSRVMDVKTVKAGEFVGYGNQYLTSRRQKLAAVPVGYYHGFARNLSNLGHVLIGGQRCGAVGVVNMNMLMADVTDVPSVKIGDEVVLIGNQGQQEITVGAFGEMTQDLNYEVLVRLPAEIPRVVVG
jgi:alanine racemase